jgi:DNA modification methylase
MNYLNKIIESDCLIGLQQLPDSLVDTCVTSPPYWGLRDYGNDQQLGMEKSPEEFVQNLVNVFREVKRVLKDDGTLWLNIGDSYCSTAPGTLSAGLTEGGVFKNISEGTANSWKNIRPITPVGMKPKDLVGMPWMLAFALRADGWYLRQDIIWSKKNCMPESVTDRCTKSHEYIFLLSKKPQYYFDSLAIKTPVVQELKGRAASFERSGPVAEHILPGQTHAQHRSVRNSGNKQRKPGELRGCPENSAANVCSSVPWQGSMANKRSVWSVASTAFKEAHFATFPENLIVDCIKAGSRENGIVLDPFMGAGTTALVASKLNRHFIGFELNPEYIKIANNRLYKGLGIFNKGEGVA